MKLQSCEVVLGTLLGETHSHIYVFYLPFAIILVPRYTAYSVKKYLGRYRHQYLAELVMVIRFITNLKKFPQNLSRMKIRGF